MWLGTRGPAAGRHIDAAEAERIKAAEEANKDVVGTGKVIIQPKHTSKLPGL